MGRTKKNREAEAYQLEHYGVIIPRHFKENGEIKNPYYTDEASVRDGAKMLEEIIEKQVAKTKELKRVLVLYNNEIRRWDEKAKETRKGYLQQATVEELEAALAAAKEKAAETKAKTNTK